MPKDTSNLIADHESWFSRRLADLLAEDGWLNLTDRIDLAHGRASLGSDTANAIVLSTGPGHLGHLVVSPDGSHHLEADAKVHKFIPRTTDGNPMLRHGDLLLEVMTVEGAPALRVRSLSLPRKSVEIPRYPFDQAWQIEADWVQLPAAEAKSIDLIGGYKATVNVSNRADFLFDGKPVSLKPTHWKAGKPMFVVRDQTSGKETYGASRFLIGEVSADKVMLDFNRAHNPPCAFTEFAVCPLPPPENILPFAIRAGEKLPVYHK